MLTSVCVMVVLSALAGVLTAEAVRLIGEMGQWK